jgi:hypothetical protein
MNKEQKHAFWSCLALIALIIAIVSGHELTDR